MNVSYCLAEFITISKMITFGEILDLTNDRL